MSDDSHASFWAELKDRKVVRVAALYSVVAWAVVGGGAQLSEILELPMWAPKLILALAVLGFPIALVLAWAFEMTAEGVKRAMPVVSKSSARPSRMPFFAGVAVGVISLSVVAFLVQEGPTESDAGASGMDTDLVAVIPFRYSGPADLDYLGDGVFQLLAARLTGEVGPRATDPTATAAVWDIASSESPTTASRDVAVRLGAGLVLTGGVVAGPDGLNISATLTDVRSGEDLASASAQGPAESLASVVDRLAGGILSLSIGEYDESLAQLTSADPEALQEYLKGQVEFRGGRWRTAYDHFVRAVSIDSTFALSSIWAADAGDNVTGAPSIDYLERAWRHQERLSERDLIYLTARLGPNYPDPSTRSERGRALRAAAELAPDRANIWYFLGENTLHFPVSNDAADVALQYFNRAAELDPRNANALLHLILSHARRGDLAGQITATEMLAEIDTTSATQLIPRWFRAIQESDSTGIVALRDSLTAESSDLAGFPFDNPSLLVGEWQIAPIVRSLEADRVLFPPGTPVAAAIAVTTYQAYQDLGMAEQGEGVLSAYERATGDRYDEVRLWDAIYGAMPERVGIAAAARLDAEHAQLGAADWTMTRVVERSALEQWRISRGDLSRVDEATQLMRRFAETRPAAHAMTVEVQALLLEAMVQVRTDDPRARATIEATDALVLQGPTSYGISGYDAVVLATADTYERLGDPESALSTLARESNFTNTGAPFGARFARERGRLADMTGDTALAIEQYRYFWLLRSQAGPEFAAEAEGIRVRLEELLAGGG